MQREAYFDNAKFLFIFLVVFGHIIQPLKGNLESADTLYQWIYLFHIPAFVLVSGFFANGARDKDYLIKLSKRIILPYLIFQILYTFGKYFSGESGLTSSLYEPHWTLWFLLSLFSWHILLIWFKRIRPLWGLTIAFTVGTLIGYLPFIGHELSLSRTFVFFPFFLMGYWLTKKQVFQLKTKAMKTIAVATLVILLTVSYFYPNIPSELIFGSFSYQAMDMSLFGFAARLGVYCVALLMVLSTLILIPKKRYGFTHLGQYTLYVYLLHGFIIQYIRQNHLLELNQNLDVIGLAIIAGAIVWFLSSKWIITFTQPVIEGKTILLSRWLEDRPKNKPVYYKEKSS